MSKGLERVDTGEQGIGEGWRGFTRVSKGLERVDTSEQGIGDG